ncbi:DNA replication/repair protein RecF [Dyella sp.]|uniref:DNA replication/repair protein RecF n=1 Tax=Dyella sp. TaxID=1869338 RepID=UPI002ED4A2CE
MRFDQLRIQGLRCLTDVTLDLDAGINVFVGDNGAGKTSVLEAAFLLSHARSFRTSAREALTQRGTAAFSVYAELMRGDARLSRLGLGRAGNRWEARVDGQSAALGQLVRDCAVVCFEPGSHALIAGAADERRRYLDWGVFHVEQSFMPAWRRYQRALKQRNSLLRSENPSEGLLLPWEAELAQSGALIDQQRQAYLGLLKPKLAEEASALLPELGTLELKYKRGWPDDRDLGEQLSISRARDISRGHTTAGVHRADWSLAFEGAPLREHLSRGQEKLTALSCMLAQAAVYADRCGEWPIVALDDLASELDEAHQRLVVERLAGAGAQILVTGTDVPGALRDAKVIVFHVEQGVVKPLL